MRFGTKVAARDHMLWFYDQEGAPLFGILSGRLLDLVNASRDRPLDLHASRPDTGWGSLTLAGDELAAFLDLLPLARRALDEAA